MSHHGGEAVRTSKPFLPNMNRRFTLIAFLALACVASAHMGIEPPEAMAGESTIVSLRIGHDCGDDTVGTTNFTIELPPGLDRVTVEQSDQWRVIIHKATFTSQSSPQILSVDEAKTEYIRAITYIGFLPDGFYQLFNLRIRFPENKGEVFWFKGYQDCHNQGTSIAWATIPSPDDPKPRYPAVNVTTI